MEYRIVPMTKEHVPQIAKLEQVCFAGEAWSEALFYTALERAPKFTPRGAYLTAVGGDGAVWGYAMMAAAVDEANLENIAVAPDHRRQGAADALLGAIIGICREREMAFLTLEVRASNVPAIALYEKHGFAPVGRRKNYYNGPREDALLMTVKFEKGSLEKEAGSAESAD